MPQASVVSLPKPRRGPPKGVRIGGRQKGTPNKVRPEITLLAQQYGPESMARMIAIMRSTDDELALKAAEIIQNRAYGKPAQALHLGGPGGEALDLSKVTNDQLDLLVATLERAILGASAEGPPLLEGTARPAEESGEGTAGHAEPAGSDTPEV